MPNIATNIGRELTTEEIDMVAGAKHNDGWRDIGEGVGDLLQGNREGWRDIYEGIHDLTGGGHKKPK
jgi:hypothetical protein